MEKRLSWKEKGKEIQGEGSQSQVPRIKVPDFDNSELMRKHSLTLIGRVTNPRQQRIWNLIPFLTDLWKTSTKAVGADLGQGKFQFQFTSEEDIQLVLKGQPYHFARWMIILQRWEPTTDKEFPSQITFWMRIEGLPVHLWAKETLTSIGNGVGRLEEYEITNTAARIRVTINGLRKLVTESVIEFANGEETLASFVYEKLGKHCSLCFRLTHEEYECPIKEATNEPELQKVTPQNTRTRRYDGNFTHIQNQRNVEWREERRDRSSYISNSKFNLPSYSKTQSTSYRIYQRKDNQS